VFAAHADPVGVGVGDIDSLARPGGNVIGLSMLMIELIGKELELLKEALPQGRRIGVLWNETTSSHAPSLKAIDVVGVKPGIQVIKIALEAQRAWTAHFRR
jgi:putative ABC transport system substrate-binding protein